MTPDRTNLHAWQQLCISLDLPEEAHLVHEEICTRYQEPQRAYHTLAHLEDCLRHLDSVLDPLPRRPQIELALWFHDIIYDPKASDNEARSAAFAEKVLRKLGAEADVVDTVSRLIHITAHQSLPHERDECLIVDIDLLILGAEPERFATYEQEIRREYNWVPEPTFRKARAQILQAFLQRPRLYVNDWFFTHYEKVARDNIGQALITLNDSEYPFHD